MLTAMVVKSGEMIVGQGFLVFNFTLLINLIAEASFRNMNPDNFCETQENWGGKNGSNYLLVRWMKISVYLLIGRMFFCRNLYWHP